MATLFKTLVLMSSGLLSCGAITENGKTPRGSGGAPAPTSKPDPETDDAAAPAVSEGNPGPVQSSDAAPSTSLEPSMTAQPAASDPPASSGTPPPQAPDCPTEEWTCGTSSCWRDDAVTCSNRDFCALLPSAACSCMPDPAPLQCPEAEVLTCLFGRFGPPEASVAHRFDCRCLPKQPACESTCDQHPSASGTTRSCRETDDAVECGGCIFAGILR